MKRNNKSNNYINRLGQEKSPYLLQHANNPVAWYPWSDEAFNRARAENKPVLLSIGYSACHWCHVMAHESFEDDTIAEFMNKHFINIKVDREEYPDVDHLYQTFVQTSTGWGGWPLTVFLTPEKIPFYGGTYFPAKPRYGMIGFPSLLEQIQEIYTNDPEKIKQSTSQVHTFFKNMNYRETSEDLPNPERSIVNLYRKLSNDYDPSNGGFSKAPKFPHVSDLRFLLQYYHYTGEESAKEMALFTLHKMANGGIYDQFGGGFHRYSTDNQWKVPHFEKMLYDNALLIPLYVYSFRMTGNEDFRRIATETTDFVLRELRDEKGPFYSTLDADSEGEEGKYYTWDYHEIKESVDADVFELFCAYYDITPQGNFEGGNIPTIHRSLSDLSRNYGIENDKILKKIFKNKQKLLEQRNKRTRPGLDNKILTDWNSMMISALWSVYQMTGKDIYRVSAETAIAYIQENLMDSDYHLYHFVKSKSERIKGYIDDYAYLIQALIDGFETTQNSDYLNLSNDLCGYTLKNFWDPVNGGFYFTDIDSDTTINRLRQNYDTSTPAGNSIMCLNLQRLYKYTGNDDFLKKVEQVFKLYKSKIENRGTAFPSLLEALSFYYYSPVEITISTANRASPTNIFQKLFSIYIPHKILVHYSSQSPVKLINQELIQNRRVKAKDAIFICYQGTCSLPIHDPMNIADILKGFKLYIN